MRRLGVAIYAGLLMLSSCGGEAAPPSPTPSPSAVPPYLEPSDSGSVEVVESGVSVLHTDSDRVDIGFGYILENTSALVATDTEVRVELLDEAGAVVWVSDDVWSHPIRTLLPGARFGSGDVTGPLGAPWIPTEASDIRVVVGDSLWYPTDPPSIQFPEVIVTDGSIEDYCEDAHLNFTVESGHNAELTATLHTVIRDPDDAIVAGSGSGAYPREVTMPPGTSSHERVLASIHGCPVPPGGDPDSLVAEYFVNPLSTIEEPEEGS